MRRTVLIAALLALAGSLPTTSFAQSNVPADINNPLTDVGTPGGRDALPTLLDADVLNLPDVQFVFDGLLDPNRVSLVEQVTRANLDDPRLTAAAQSIIRNHLVALQQVELAIQFLQTNRDEILAGGNSEFNSVFGNPGETRPIAVVNPTPVQGRATVVTSLTGAVILDFPDQTIPNLPDQINQGDFVFVGDAISGDPLGFIMEVEQVVFADDATDQLLVGTSIFGGSVLSINRTGVPVHKVITFEERTDPARFERVIQTFEAIRNALSGFDPDLPPIFQVQNSITYQRSFEDINNVWAPGIAQFTALDSVVQRELNRTGLTSTRPADRLLRQAGFSNSDSHLHLDRLDDQGSGQTADYQGRATFPLLWTEDNELPLNFNTNSPLAGATDEDRAYFRDRQTIFGAPDNPFTQYIGRAFLEETTRHGSDFFDDTIVVLEDTVTQNFQQPIFDGNGRLVGFRTVTVSSPLELAQREARRAQRGPLADLDGNGRFDDLEVRQVPESGTPVEQQTERRKWEMIVESFAEHSTDLNAFNVAAVGVSDMFNDFVPTDLLARNAGSFADFASLIGGGNTLNGIDPTRIEPFGKRGTAGFNPVVPRN
ncbi:MAG: hypothetical protein ACI93T_000038 [Porticoccaceae bacterium]|jgi:hypothetical protein